MKKMLNWGLVLFVSIIFIQSLFFKFSGAEESKIIFSTIGQWMADIGLPAFISETFINLGAYIIGVFELIAAILLLIPASRKWGALLGLNIISAAIFFHLFTPLGVNRVVDAAGNTDGGQLFYMACAIFVALIAILFIVPLKTSKHNFRTDTIR